MNRSNDPVSIVRARDWCLHICRMNTTTGLALVKTNFQTKNLLLMNDLSFIISGFYSTENVGMKFFLFFCKYIKHVCIAFVLV